MSNTWPIIGVELGPNRTMSDARSPIKGTPLGPYSRRLARGAVGDGVDGRSREGRFLRQLEKELLAQLAREPSFGERVLIRRIVRATLQLELFDAKLAAGNEFTAHDARAFSALSNQVRLGLRDLGLKASPKPKAANPLADHFAKPAREARG
jgi:hypothetical protein